MPSKQEISDKEFKCCVCGETEKGFGHNAEPFMKGKCCGFCNYHKVIPFRVEKFKKELTEKLMKNMTNNK